jgi:hypothetical protein
MKTACDTRNLKNYNYDAKDLPAYQLNRIFALSRIFFM